MLISVLFFMCTDLKRVISGALVFVILFFVCMSTVSASDTGSLDTPARGDFWAWVQMKDNAFKSIFDKDICPKSPNTNGLHEFAKTTTTVDGKTGLYYVADTAAKAPAKSARKPTSSRSPPSLLPVILLLVRFAGG